MRLIDADALWEIFREKQSSLTARRGGYRFLDGEDRAKYDRLEITLDYIENAPEVDAVQVVRCGECRYRELAKVNCKGYTICPASGMEITDDDFCSYGERKEDRK